MDPVVSSPSSGRIAWNQGLRFGIIIAVVQVIIDIIVAFVPGISLLSYLGTLVLIVGLVLAGMYATRLTGRVGTGTLAGLYAGLIAGVIGFIVSIILLFTVEASRANQIVNQAGANGAVSTTTVAIAGIIGIVLVLLIDIGIGAGLGAIGGLIGRSQYRGQAPVHQESYYQGAATTDAPVQTPVNQSYEPTSAVVQTPPANESYEPAQTAEQTPPLSDDPNLNNPA